ncbi:MAG: hypothetical protein AVDCRST_MAG57-1940, partial [uncultured Blastococcus sp.]
ATLGRSRSRSRSRCRSRCRCRSRAPRRRSLPTRPPGRRLALVPGDVRAARPGSRRRRGLAGAAARAPAPRRPAPDRDRAERCLLGGAGVHHADPADPRGRRRTHRRPHGRTRPRPRRCGARGDGDVPRHHRRRSAGVRRRPGARPAHRGAAAPHRDGQPGDDRAGEGRPDAADQLQRSAGLRAAGAPVQPHAPQGPRRRADHHRVGGRPRHAARRHQRDHPRRLPAGAAGAL